MRRPVPCFVLLLLVLAPATVVVGQSPPPAGDPMEFTVGPLSGGEPTAPTDIGAPAAHRLPSADAAVTATSGPRSVVSQVKTRQTLFRVSMTRNGDAQWTVTTLYELSDGAEREAFEEFVTAYRAGETAVGPDVATWRRAAASAADATDRPMTIQDVSRSGGLRNQTTGAVVLRFRWTNFAQETDDRTFRVGDVFQMGANTWLPRIDADQTLVVETVADARITSTNYPLTDFEIRVLGPQDLAADPVDVTYTLASTDTESPTSRPPPTTTTTRPATTTTTTQQTPAPPGGTEDVIAFGAVVVAIAAAVVALVISRGGLAGVADVDTTDDGEAAADVTPASSDDSTDTDATDTDAASSPDPTDGESSAATASEATAGTESESDPDPELLSDEERVEHLLEQNGGRMRQADIVSETGWSDAKVSQLLSAMAEDDRVDKLRLGRENLISFPDVDGTDDNGE